METPLPAKLSGRQRSCSGCGLGIIAERFIERCPRCGESLASSHLVNDEPSEAERKIAICRSNVCGQYDAANDACLVVIAAGRAKGQARPGKIAWLYGHPDAACPADPPQF